ncbi:S-type anion channel SLAH3-like protein [Corchorus olitorius]|uniref:S-type anion channel SLAH3-like protein n=1 Tax=Corchorus olitorius TaxID=93759 RepID=A0A1R3H740_9ROSI|nr:S-type anion channel SLAH3-like protein [Corchorus olitorius]
MGTQLDGDSSTRPANRDSPDGITNLYHKDSHQQCSSSPAHGGKITHNSRPGYASRDKAYPTLQEPSVEGEGQRMAHGGNDSTSASH